MRIIKTLTTTIAAFTLAACQSQLTMSTSDTKKTVRIATFNVSMEASNYTQNKQQKPSLTTLINALASGEHPQIRNVAEIIQRTRPDILLLNEFDYIPQSPKGIEKFIQQYLKTGQNGQAAIDYPYVYVAPVNTGVRTDLSGENVRLSHYGFGRYPGQYGMAIVSKFPIDEANIRTFQRFLWRDMPNHLMPQQADGQPWYSEQETELMRLSSKSHWDVPINVCGKTLNLLASHPTPPVFDGPEDRNGRRNHDEIRFWRDYIDSDQNSYHYDDKGQHGGLTPNASFVVLGDLNANDVEGDAYPNAMGQLLNHPRINNYPAPISDGGLENKPQSQYAATHTAYWGMRADYVLPSSNLKVVNSGVFWPAKSQSTFRLVADRSSSSDHRLVWADIALSETGNCAQ